MKDLEYTKAIYQKRIDLAESMLKDYPNLSSFIKLKLKWRISYYQKLINNLK